MLSGQSSSRKCELYSNPGVIPRSESPTAFAAIRKSNRALLQQRTRGTHVRMLRDIDLLQEVVIERTMWLLTDRTFHADQHDDHAPLVLSLAVFDAEIGNRNRPGIEVLSRTLAAASGTISVKASKSSLCRGSSRYRTASLHLQNCSGTIAPRHSSRPVNTTHFSNSAKDFFANVNEKRR